MEWDYGRPWYHGSPCRLAALRPGSTITQNRDLARAFSHKPAIVSISDDGQIKHNGAAPGFLYRLDEAVGPEDVYPHPRSSMPEGLEWLTARELAVTLIGPTTTAGEEWLAEEEVAQLLRRSRGEACDSGDTGSGAVG